MLADYAVRAEQSRGRRFPQAQHRYRNDFQRDRDRIIHARAFRRLESKTQVFTHRYSDHFRNRLTHTLEVSQIARTVAAQLGLNVDLVEALALVHDVGHPPFGHAGEKVLDTVMRQHGFSFDHNLHALRIVEDFEVRYAAFRGLNLTFEVREGIIKHSRDYSAKDFPELAEYLLDLRPPLEAQLIDMADEVAYNTADLDDGLEAQLLSLDQIRSGLPAFESFYREADKAYPNAPEKLKFNEALRELYDRLAGDLIRNIQRRLKDEKMHNVEDVRAFPQRLAGFSLQVDAERRQIKEFLRMNVYQNAELDPGKEDAEKIISGLFALWMKNPEKLPRTYLEKEDPLPRVICDYIAGMTDNFIYEQYEKYCS
jgi:dGTPase